MQPERNREEETERTTGQQTSEGMNSKLLIDVLILKFFCPSILFPTFIDYLTGTGEEAES